MKRKIIQIDEEKCNGCGLCIPECKEGAIRIIEGKARLISDLFCDGLGACLGHCPEDAITIIEKEAEPYNEKKVMEQLMHQPKAVLMAHLKHLTGHNETDNYNIAVSFLQEKGIENPVNYDVKSVSKPSACGCPGSMTVDMSETKRTQSGNNQKVNSELKQWPVQLHLVNPLAPYFKNSDLVVLSTCSPIAYGNVQQDYIKDKALVVACPKLDYTAPYTEKLSEIFKANNTPKAIVVLMEVPCCKGLSKIVTDARAMAGRDDMKIEEHTITLDGRLKSINFL
jgi:ferredoxin